MEQLQRIDIFLHLHDGAVKLQRIVNQFFQSVEVYVVAKELAGHIVGNVLETQLRHIVEECLWQFVNLFGHVESSVFGQSFHDGLAQVGHGGLMVGAVVFHASNACYYWLQR